MKDNSIQAVLDAWERWKTRLAGWGERKLG
jgi:hypothetical protein